MTSAFFEKHHTLFMVLMALGVLGFLLFGSWQYVGPALSEWFGGGMNREVGTIDGESVRLADVQGVYSDLRVAREAMTQCVRILGAKLGATREDVEGLWRALLSVHARAMPDESRDVSVEQRMAWYAVYQEAKAAGIGISMDHVESRLKRLHEMGLTGEEFQAVLTQVVGGDVAHFKKAIQTDMTFHAYEMWVLQSVNRATVDPELRRVFAKIDDRVQVRVAVLKAEDYEKGVKAPTDEAVAKQFATHKAYLAGQGPDGCGYMIPDRVSIEYLVVDPKAFEGEARSQVTEEDIAKYYEACKDPDYVVPETDAAAPSEETPKDAAAAETAKPKEKTFRPLTEVHDAILATLTTQKAWKIAMESFRDNVSEIRTNREKPDLELWADGVRVKHVVVSGLLTAAEMGKLEGIGRAVHGQSTAVGTAFSLAELMADRAKASLAVGEISDIFVDDAGQGYAFRVTGCEARHEPASLAEVVDQVKADLRVQAAYEVVCEKAKALETAAAEKGLEKAAKEAKVEVAESGLCQEHQIQGAEGSNGSFPWVATLPAAANAYFRMAWDAQKVTRVEMPEARSVVVAELADHRLPREALYELIRGQIAAKKSGMRDEMILGETLGDAAVIARHQITVAKEEQPQPAKPAESVPAEEKK